MAHCKRKSRGQLNQSQAFGEACNPTRYCLSLNIVQCNNNNTDRRHITKRHDMTRPDMTIQYHGGAEIAIRLNGNVTKKSRWLPSRRKQWHQRHRSAWEMDHTGIYQLATFDLMQCVDPPVHWPSGSSQTPTGGRKPHEYDAAIAREDSEGLRTGTTTRKHEAAADSAVDALGS